MITSKKLKFIGALDCYNCYIFKPSLFSYYYNDGKSNQWPSFRKTLKHKIHMMLYVLFGGYKIFYIEKDKDIVSYLIYRKGGKMTVKGSNKSDFYTIYLFTYPDYRNKGIASLMTNYLINSYETSFSKWYKTIEKDNFPSKAVAIKNGFKPSSEAFLKGLLRIVVPCDSGKKELYIFQSKKN